MGSIPTSSIIRSRELAVPFAPRFETMCPVERSLRRVLFGDDVAKGLLRESSPGSLAPETRIMPLDEAAHKMSASPLFLSVAASLCKQFRSEAAVRHRPCFLMLCIL